MMDDDSVDFVSKSTLCRTCYYYAYREVMPFEEAVDEWEEEFNIEIGEDTIIEVHTCCLLNIDLDHYVLKCNKYVAKDQVNFNNNLRLFR